jgi:hypothetical protein
LFGKELLRQSLRFYVFKSTEFFKISIYPNSIVLDKRSRILEVVVVRHILVGYWEFGVGRE